jgi:hypothetical protein
MAPVGGQWLAGAMRGTVSPYQSNPLGLNPLRDLLRDTVDFEAVAAGPLKVFVSATHVATGRAVVFTGKHLDADAVLASACLPLLFKAVEIGGEAYWDGGYSANPALTPLIQECASADLMLVQINPLRVADAPHAAPEILDRINEITFNASLLTQMRTIEFINGLIAQGALRGDRQRTVRMHRIDGGEHIRAYPSSTRNSTDAAMIHALFASARPAARHWLERHYDALGPRHGGHPARLPRRHAHHVPQRPSKPRRATPQASGPGWRSCCAGATASGSARRRARGGRARPASPRLHEMATAQERHRRPREADSGEGWLACSTSASRPWAHATCPRSRPALA